VFLPLADKPDQEGLPAPIEAPRGLERVLVVDDEDASRTTAGQLLERLGYRITTVGDPLSALDLFRTDPALFDLALIDYDMPGMTGTHLAIEMLVLRPDLPIHPQPRAGPALEPE